MPTIDYSRFYRYDDLMAILRSFADENPDYVSVETIGTSHEGRAIPVVTLTHRATGAATDKPAYWVDGNIHSIELTASSACLYFIDWLMKERASHADVARAPRVVRVRSMFCPRIQPDGAEWAMGDNPRYGARRRGAIRLTRIRSTG